MFLTLGKFSKCRSYKFFVVLHGQRQCKFVLVETWCKFIIAKLSIVKLADLSLVLLMHYYSSTFLALMKIRVYRNSSTFLALMKIRVYRS